MFELASDIFCEKTSLTRKKVEVDISVSKYSRFAVRINDDDLLCGNDGAYVLHTKRVEALIRSVTATTSSAAALASPASSSASSSS